MASWNPTYLYVLSISSLYGLSVRHCSAKPLPNHSNTHSVAKVDPQQHAQHATYLQRVRESARALAGSMEEFPPAAEVCWYCVAQGDLNEALNEIAIQNQSQLKALGELSNRLDKYQQLGDQDVSEVDMQRAEEALKTEREMAMILEEECNALEMQLEMEMRETAKFTESYLAAHNSVTMAQDTLESLKNKLENCEMQIQAMPRSVHEIWSDFFPIEDKLDHATIHGVPLAYLPTNEAWNANSKNVKNISAALTLLASLLGRLTTLFPFPPEAMQNRPYRILTTPACMESRTGSPRTSFSLLPVIGDKPQPTWSKALRLLSDYVAMLFRCWNQNPTHQLPNESDGDSYFELDTTKASQWNEKMRFLLLNVCTLRDLRFPPP